MARAQWVALEQLNTLPDTELRQLIAESYRLVWERIPQKRRAELEKGQPVTAKKTSPAATKKAQPVKAKKKAVPAKSKSVKSSAAKAGKGR
jgi:hypothetical protein